MPEYDDNIDNNLDDQIDDMSLFDDFDIPDPDTDNRKPAKAGQVITKNLLSATSAFTKTAANEVAESLPRTQGLFSEFVEIKESLDEFKEEFQKNYKPTINEVKKAMYKSLPMAEKYIPKTLYDKIENKLKDYEEEIQIAKKSKEQLQEESIARDIAKIFAAQEEIRSGERTEDRVTDMVEKVTDATRHAENKKIFGHIANSLQWQNQFVKTTQTAWMKKMLELKYISVYTQRETLSTLKIQVSMLETKLEEMKHNSAIPDWNKWTTGDLFRKGKRNVLVGQTMKAAPSVKNYISATGRNLVGSAKQSMQGIMSGLRSQASMMGTAADLQSSMPSEEPSGPGTWVGSTVGGLSGKWFGRRKLADRLLPLLETIEDTSSNIKDTAFFKGKRLKEQMEGKGSIGASLLASFLGDHSESMDVPNELLQDPTQPVPLDRAMRQAIVEIIPAYLSKIAKYTKDTATGKDNEQEMYDVVTRQMTTKSQAEASMEGYVFGKRGARSQDAMVAVGQLSAGMERNAFMPGMKEDFKNREEHILKFINNSAITNEILYPKMIQAFAEGDEEAAASPYIQKTFNDIPNPRAVATLIAAAIYTPDGKLDKKIVRKIEGSIVRASSSKTWRDRLPQMLEAQGGYSVFKGSGILSDENVVQEGKLSSMMSDVTSDELRSQVDLTSGMTVRDLQERELQEAKLMEDYSRMTGRRQPPPLPPDAYSRLMGKRPKRQPPPIPTAEERGQRWLDKYDRMVEDQSPEVVEEYLPIGRDRPVDMSGSMNEFGSIMNEYIGIQNQTFTTLQSIQNELKDSRSEAMQYYAYRREIDDKTIDAYTDTDNTQGFLGPHDIFEKIQMDLQTLTESSIKSSTESLMKLDDIIAAAELSLELAQQRTTDMQQLKDLTKQSIPRKVFGDTDMDNIREGSYADQMKDKAMRLKYGLPAGIGSLSMGRPSGKQPPPIPGQENEDGIMDQVMDMAPLLALLAVGGGTAAGQNIAERGTGIGKIINYGQKLGSGAKAAFKSTKFGQKIFNVAKGAKGLVSKGGALSRFMLPGFARGGGKISGKLLGWGGKAFGAGARGLGKAAGPITALAEMAYGAGTTGLDAEAAEADLQDKLSREDSLVDQLGIFGQVGKYTGGNAALMALGADKWKKNWQEDGALVGTAKNAWESLGVFKNLGTNIGTFAQTSIDTVKEFKGPEGYKQLVDTLKNMKVISDPVGWGDWVVNDWNKLGNLSPENILMLKTKGADKFSKGDLKTMDTLWKAAVRRRQKKDADRKKSTDIAKVVTKTGETPQAANTTTDSTGRTVVDTYQAPKTSTPDKTEAVEMAKQEIEMKTGKLSETQLEELKQSNELNRRSVAALEIIAGNTGNLGDIKKDLGETTKAMKEPKVVVANTGDSQSKRPKIHRPSVNIAQRG